MKIVLSLNKKEYLYDYISMGIDTFILGCDYSFYTPCVMNKEDIMSIRSNYPHIKLYVALNALYDQHMIKDIESFIEFLYDHHIDGILYQDFGVLQIVKEKGYTFDMMYSPETLNTNDQTLNTLQHYGVTSAFISKVIPLEEQVLIQQNTTIPLMIQVHGVEYIGASKRKLLSNYQEASSKEFDKSVDAHLSIQAKDSTYPIYIYENQYGTRLFSKSQLYALDLYHYLENFDYLYIETLYMEDTTSLEVASLYSDALHSYQNNTYDKDIKEYLPLLTKLKITLDRGFLFDQTVYKLEDMRKIDHERNK